MEFHEKLQELRKQKNLTQEELSEILFVSRTAISKWESGRGYPSIDSLKAIAEFFGVTIDELLSNRELICIAEKDSHQKTQHMRDLVFGLIDCSVVMLFFIPLFGQQGGEIIRQVSFVTGNTIVHKSCIFCNHFINSCLWYCYVSFAKLFQHYLDKNKDYLIYDIDYN